MLDSLYVGLTGLSSYAKGLNVISNNVANLNTPGFKGSQLQFADLCYRQDEAGVGGHGSRTQLGSGVGTGGTFLNFQQGEARSTGNDLDLLIDGPGLFVLRQGGQLAFSRAGQFQFDAEGFLVDRTQRARVAVLDDNGQLADISLSGLRASPPQATSTVRFAGNLSSADNQHAITGLTVYDALGGATTLNLNFDNTGSVTPGSWRVSASLPDGTVAGTGELRLANGQPVVGFDQVSLRFTPPSGEPLALVLDFSRDVTAYSSGTDSTLAVATQDGYGPGALLKTTFDDSGHFTTTYSNGQTRQHGRLALAWFVHSDALEQVGDNRFVSRWNAPPQLGHPGDPAFGKVQGGRIESSNVDLSQQFSEMIITQRGYQASSQVITTTNELIQQLMDLRGKR